MELFVTGIGVMTAIGNTVAENFHSLKVARTGIQRSAKLGLMLGEVSFSNEEIIEKLGLTKIDYSRTTLLGMLAAKEAWGKNEHKEEIATGLISATSAGGMDRIEKYFAQAHHEGMDTSRRMTYENGRTTEGIAKELGIKGYIGTISTACSSGANAIMHGARLIQSGRLDRVLVGGVDPLVDYNIKGFSSLGIYAEGICTPFDQNRKGLNLGEGAAFLVLESAASLSITGNKPLCLLSGWDNSTDAFHQTASSADGKGATLAMKHALKKAKLLAKDISYVNVHGTGTQNNDLSESAALRNVFGHKMPPFSSTKSFTGHTLAAAGAIEAVYCILSLRSNAIFPSLNFSTPIKATGLIPATSFREKVEVKHALTNAFGFGGNCTCLIFSKKM